MALENIIRESEQLGVPDGTLAVLSGISGTVFSKLRNGGQIPTGEQIVRLEETLTRLQRLADQCSPIPVNFSAVGKLRSLLTEMERGSIIIVALRESEPVQVSSK